ncbi:MAG TPA: SRPBCC family protein [Flavobacteriales bacterium]
MSDLNLTIRTTRVMKAPRHKVFRAWTDAALLAQWWGPNGFTNTIQVFEPQPGGAWRLTMQGPDGATYPNESRFIEVVPDQRVVFEHLRPMHPFRAEVHFTDAPGGTHIDWRMIHPNKEEHDRVIGFVPQANEENLDRLEGVLERMAVP